MQRIGRRRGFVLGSLAGAAGGGLSVWAVFHTDLWAFCAGTALVGVYPAFAQYYRLTAADAVEPAAKSRAISVVMAGGVIAAIAGPALTAWSRELFAPIAFTGAYLMVALLSAALLWCGYHDAEAPAAAGEILAGLPARPLCEVARQPVFVAALANNVVGSVSMMFIMTAAPLAAVACSHSIGDGADIMQWHLVGMYAPAFFAGTLIQRFGLPRVLGAGMLLNVACSLIAMSSPSLPAFYAAQLCLGGWLEFHVRRRHHAAGAVLPSVGTCPRARRGRDVALCRYRAGQARRGTGAARFRMGSAERSHAAGSVSSGTDDMVVGTWAVPGGCGGRATLTLRAISARREPGPMARAIGVARSEPA